MRLTRLAVPALLLALAYPLDAQNQEPPPAPVFRAEVDLIAIDVTVLDDRGRPVPDLLAPEFSVTINGEPRRIVSAEFISFGDPTPRFGRLREPDPEPNPHFSSNDAAETGRLIVIAIDQSYLPLGIGAALAEAAGRFLDGLTPADQVSLLTIPPPGPSVGFTTRHSLVREAFPRVIGALTPFSQANNLGLAEALTLYEGADPVERRDVMNRECEEFPVGSIARVRCEDQVMVEAMAMVAQARARTQESLAGLRAVLNSLRDIEGPKSLVLISSGLMIADRLEDLSDVAAAAAAAHVTINVLLLERPAVDFTQLRLPRSPARDRLLYDGGLEALAGLTRGALFRDIGAGGTAFERIQVEMSGYYLLGIEPTDRDRDGRRHRINVDVRRRGVTVRSRREFILGNPGRETRSPNDALAGALRSPAMATEIPLRVASYAFQEDGSPRVRIVLAAEIGVPTNDAADYTVGFVLFDSSGNVVASNAEHRTKTPADGRPHPFNYSSGVLVEPGIYTLKLAAVDGDGRLGSVEHTLHAWQMAGQDLAVGDLLLATIPDVPADGLQPGVIIRPEDDVLVAYTELYANDPARFDDVQVVVEVGEDESGPALVTAEARLGSAVHPERRNVQALLQLDTLPPGEYVARATVLASGSPVGKLTRPFEILRPLAGPGIVSRGSPPPGIVVTSGPFQRESVFVPEVIGYALDALQNRSGAANANVRAAIASARDGKFQGTALRAFEGGDQTAAAFLRGLELLAAGQLNQAATQFQVAQTAEPAFFPAALYLGACFAAVGRDQEAAGYWKGAPSGEVPPGVYSLLGDVWIRLGDPERAIATLTDAAIQWPENPEIRRRLGIAYAANQEGWEALAVLDPYLASNPDDHETLLVAIHAIYEAYLSGRTIEGLNEDRERVWRYARAYAAAEGPQQTLVTQWAEFVASIGAGRR